MSSLSFNPKDLIHISVGNRTISAYPKPTAKTPPAEKAHGLLTLRASLVHSDLPEEEKLQVLGHHTNSATTVNQTIREFTQHHDSALWDWESRNGGAKIS